MDRHVYFSHRRTSLQYCYALQPKKKKKDFFSQTSCEIYTPLQSMSSSWIFAKPGCEYKLIVPRSQALAFFSSMESWKKTIQFSPVLGIQQDQPPLIFLRSSVALIPAKSQRDPQSVFVRVTHETWFMSNKRWSNCWARWDQGLFTRAKKSPIYQRSVSGFLSIFLSFFPLV